MLHQLTSKQYYHGLNRRFVKRAAQLHRFGFRYQRTELGFAVFTREPRGYWPRSHVSTIPAEVLHHASNRAWIDRLCDVLILTTP